MSAGVTEKQFWEMPGANFRGFSWLHGWILAIVGAHSCQKKRQKNGHLHLAALGNVWLSGGKKRWSRPRFYMIFTSSILGSIAFDASWCRKSKGSLAAQRYSQALSPVDESEEERLCGWKSWSFRWSLERHFECLLVWLSTWPEMLRDVCLSTFNTCFFCWTVWGIGSTRESRWQHLWETMLMWTGPANRCSARSNRP